MLKKLSVLFFFFLVTSLFFYKTLLHGLVPFPGDLLISEYNPWKTYSYLGYNPGSFPNKAQYFDVIRQLYPWKTFVVDSIKNGQFPLWNPYNFSGTPLFANFQSAVIYPLSFFYYILPQIYAWSLLVILQPFLASLFTYFYCRKIGISGISSFFAGITFGFSSFMAVWLEYNTIGHVILWLPLILLAIENMRSKTSIFWSLILVFSIVSSLFAGHPQLFSYIFVFTLIYILANNIKNQKNLWGLIILSLGIGSVQLIPGLELIFNSARTQHDLNFFYSKILIQWWQLVMIFVPDFFGNPATRNYWVADTFVGDVIYFGVVPLIFIQASLKTLKNNSYTKFYAATALITLILITLNPLSFLFYKIPIPSVLGSGVNFLVFILIFACAILSGIGMDFFKENKNNIKQYISILIFPIAVFLATELLIKQKYSWSPNLSSAVRPIVYSAFLVCASVLLVLVSKLKQKYLKYFLITILVIQIFDLFRFFVKFNPFVPVKTVFPKAEVAENLKSRAGIDRYFGYSDAYIEANFDTELKLYSPNGYDPLYPRVYGEFVHLSRDGKLAKQFDITTRSDAVISQNVDKYSLKVLDLLGVSYILNRSENKWKVSKSSSAMPRIFLSSDYKVYNSKEEFEDFFPTVDFRKTILLNEEPGTQFETDESSSLSLLTYQPNIVEVKTNSKKNQLLFLSDEYYPGWKAYIDEEETKIFRADYAFRAVAVPSGQHQISFIYDPDSFKVGKWVSIFSIGALFFYVFRRKILRYNYKR